MKNDIITVEITDLLPDGNGIGRRDDGKAVFIPDTAPGDIAEAVIIKELSSRSIGRLRHVVKPSPMRAEADCPVSQSCGGCVFRHIKYEAEAEIKRGFVASALARIGGREIPVGETVTRAPDGYRNKVQYPFAPDENGKNNFGYYARRSHRMVRCGQCRLQSADFYRVAESLAHIADELGLEPYDEITRRGVIRHLVMRRNRAGEMLVCIIAAREDARVAAAAEMLFGKEKCVIGVQESINSAPGNAIFGGTARRLCGAEKLYDTLCGRKFAISARSFYQVNADVAEALYTAAAELAGQKTGGHTILDLYCGTGTIGLCVAGGGDRLCGVEIIPEAVENARENAALNGRSAENTHFVCGDAGVGVAECTRRFGKPDIIIVDPPRKGLDAAVIETIAAAAPERVIYISCDPATLSRDIALLSEHGYSASGATPFDMFPRTGHVETVVLLSHQRPKDKIRVELDLAEMDITASETEATYREIKDYIFEQHGVKVSSLYIAQVKEKHGIKERECYNKPKSENPKQLHCPAEKEKLIEEALKHFKMI